MHVGIKESLAFKVLIHATKKSIPSTTKANNTDEKGIEKSGTDRFNLNIYTTVEPEGTSNKLGG